MGLHKLTAGDGYTYLIRQVAALDASERGHGSLGDYYAQKGESPGRWLGRGLAGLGMAPGDEVTEAQMVALFGGGRHPDAEAIRQQALANGGTEVDAAAATDIGRPFPVRDEVTMFRKAVADRCADWNAEQGLPRDRPVPAEERARIRSELGAELFTAEFGRSPADERELSGFIARATRQATTAVAGYDLTFSPVKSVSALWAIAPREVACEIEAAHDAAVADTLAWVEEHGAYTRLGHNSVRHVDVTGLIAAAFTHRDSRAGDPDLHTHVAVSNKVQTLDGKWRALDGQVLHKVAVAASERYNTRLEAHLIHRLGVRFAERLDADVARRPIREVVGVDEKLIQAWSARRAAVEARQGELALEFQETHGRPPTVVELIALAQQATLETRQVKHEPRSYAEQRDAWRREALTVLGGASRLDDMLRRVRRTRTPRERPTREWVRSVAEQAVSTVQAARATWQGCHLRAEAERRVRGADVPLTDVDATVDEIVAHALAISVPVGHRDPVEEPVQLRRRDGTSVYDIPAMQAYTSPAILAAEQSLIAAASRTDGPVASDASVDLALLESTANGLEPNPAQAHLARELATSPRRLQLALAPAGTGKTTALGLLSRAWTDSGGSVVGLAPSAAAASVLRHEVGAHTDTLAKLLHCLDTADDLPAWVRSIGPGALVIVDEASMASTLDLARMVQYVIDRGGSVRLIGDDQQLAAIGAGGVLRDIADSGAVVTLSQVVRFTDPAEGAASLAIRAGDPAGLGYYLDHGRVHVGVEATVVEHAYRAWSADRAAGRDSLMLAPTRELVAALNARARADRISIQGSAPGREITLADGSSCTVGDAIITRRNERRLPTSSTDWVKNGDRWTVDEVLSGGALEVTHTATGHRATLPASYVAHDVALGYATTVHGAQGVTADTCHSVATGAESRQLLYVALTRGRVANHIWLATTGDGDEHAVIHRDALLPPTAADILARVLARDGSEQSAASLIRTLADPAMRLPDAADRYHDALTVAAEDVLGPDGLAAIDEASEAAAPGLTSRPAYPTLRSHLALLAVRGTDVHAALVDAVGRHEITTAHDAAAVLDWRLTLPGAGPLPWQPDVPSVLADHPAWGAYLAARRTHVADLAQHVGQRFADLDAATTPRWASGFGDRDAALLSEVAVWRAAMRVDNSDLRPTGPPRPYAAEARAQRNLDRRIESTVGRADTPTGRWTPLACAIETRILADPYWPQLADRFTAADRAGIDIRALAARVAGERPLPDEHPAAALWWRISRHLSPATLEAPTFTLRPDWTPALATIVGTAAAERLTEAAAWPALVASVSDATHQGWRPDHVLAAAHDLLAAGLPDDEIVGGDELARALAWRVSLLAGATAEEFGFPAATQDLPVCGPSADDGDNDVRTPYPHLDPELRVDALRADLASARQATCDAWTAYCKGESPHVLAVTPLLLDMRRRADELRPDLVDLQVARGNWLDADAAAKHAEKVAVDLREAVNAALSEAYDDRMIQFEPLYAFAAMSADNLRAEADHVRSEWAALDARLRDKASGAGLVTDADVDAARRTAEDLDLHDLTALRRRVAQLEGAVFRAEASRTQGPGARRDAADDHVPVICAPPPRVPVPGPRR